MAYIIKIKCNGYQQQTIQSFIKRTFGDSISVEYINGGIVEKSTQESIEKEYVRKFCSIPVSDEGEWLTTTQIGVRLYQITNKDMNLSLLGRALKSFGLFPKSKKLPGDVFSEKRYYIVINKIENEKKVSEFTSWEEL